MTTEAASFDQSPITICPLSLESPESLAESAERHGMPRLDEFLDHIRVLHAGEEEHYGRRYQREIIQNGEFRLPSPFSGQFVSSTRSYLIKNKVFYRFDDSPEFFVLASRVSRGYPLSGIFVPAAQLMVLWDLTQDRNITRDLESLNIAIQHTARGTSRRDRRVAIVMGNSNFAHHLWNELPALEQLLASGIPAVPPEIIMRREPLGPIDSIFPEIAKWKIHRRPLAEIPDALYVKLGSYRISVRVRNRLLAYARGQVSSEIALLIQRIRSLAGPVFWLSVRLPRPTLENQREALLAVCQRLLNCNGRCCILFDGFSLPEDWSTADPTHVEDYRNAAEASRREIEELIGQVSRFVRHSQLVVNVGGIRLLDSIALAELVDAYFCHSGSIQHKIAWTANKPGIVHGARRALRSDVATWHSERLEGAEPPLPIPVSMIEDVRDEEREYNYRAHSWAVARFVANYFSYHVRH